MILTCCSFPFTCCQLRVLQQSYLHAIRNSQKSHVHSVLWLLLLAQEWDIQSVAAPRTCVWWPCIAAQFCDVLVKLFLGWWTVSQGLLRSPLVLVISAAENLNFISRGAVVQKEPICMCVDCCVIALSHTANSRIKHWIQETSGSRNRMTGCNKNLKQHQKFISRCAVNALACWNSTTG